MKLIIKGGRVIDPKSNLDAKRDIVIEEGYVVKILSSSYKISKKGKVKIIEAKGKWVVPGLIDIHTHLRDPGEEYKEDLETGLGAAVAGGFTAVCSMPNTNPPNDCAQVTEYLLSRASKIGKARLYPIGAISKGLLGQALANFGEMKESGIVAVSDDGRPVMNSLLMRRAMEYAKTFKLPVITHCEDLNLSQGGVMHEGEVSCHLGLKGIPSEAENIMISRDIALTKLTNSQLHIAHLSTKESINLLKHAKTKGIKVSGEVTPHHLTLTDSVMYGYPTNAKVKPPLRTNKDRERLVQGLKEGIIEVIASDHAPHSSIEKEIEFERAAFGISGLELALPLALRLVHNQILTPLELITTMSTNPAKILNIPGGEIKVGTPADITIIDPELRYKIDTQNLVSKGKNTPFIGWEFKGKAIYTLVQGEIVYQDPSFAKSNSRSPLLNFS
jgi:dihydroorotase